MLFLGPTWSIYSQQHLIAMLMVISCMIFLRLMVISCMIFLYLFIFYIYNWYCTWPKSWYFGLPRYTSWFQLNFQSNSPLSCFKVHRFYLFPLSYMFFLENLRLNMTAKQTAYTYTSILSCCKMSNLFWYSDNEYGT